MNQREAAEFAGRKYNIFLRDVRFLCFDFEWFPLAQAESVFYIPAWALASDISDIECNKIGVT